LGGGRRLGAEPRVGEALTLGKAHLPTLLLGCGWSKYAGEAGKDMELLARIDLCIQQFLKADLGNSIPQL